MDYLAKDIRNVCLIGHKGNGKTSLAEAMLFFAKATDRLGKTESGNTVCDYDAEEIKRKISISLAAAPFTYKNTKINIIDTPGFYDFEGEQIAALSVADTALIVLSAKTTVSVGTEKAVKNCTDLKIPFAFFINGLDDENADFYKTLEQLWQKFNSTSIIPMQLPLVSGGKVIGIVDILTGTAYKYDGAARTKCDIPAELADDIEKYKGQINEIIAETSEQLMDKFFAEEPFDQNEINKGIKDAIAQGIFNPVFCGVPINMLGVEDLVDNISAYFPCPSDRGAVIAQDDKGEKVEVKCDQNGPCVLQIFKTIADPFVGKLSLFKVYSGTVSKDQTYDNINNGEKEKIAHVYTPFGKRQDEVDKLYVGDIGVFTKLNATNTGDTLTDKGAKIKLQAINFPKPNFSKAILPKAKGDEEKISQGIRRLMEEDPTLSLENNVETKQQIISGLGDMQLDIVVSKLKSKFGTDVELADVKVAYRETIKKKVKVEGKHKKQSGGHGQYGHVWIEFEPCYDQPFVFEEKIFGGAVPKNFFPAVEKGLRESIQKGVLAGYPVTNIKCTLVDGSYHPVDSSEMAFKTAASIAFKEGMKQAGPTLLEPVGTLVVNVSDALMGDIIGDFNKRRGQVLSMDVAPDPGRKLVTAIVPMSEMTSYAMDLRSMTHSRASFTFEFLEYREAPANIAQKVAEESAAE